MINNIRIGKKLYDLSKPKVMGIINITPDSFYSESRFSTIETTLSKVKMMIEDGVDMIDIGGYSNNVDMSHLPIFVAPYLNDFETKSMFPLTPWLAYIFAGALLGLWLNHEIKQEHFEKRIGYKLALIGIGFLLLSYFGDIFERFYHGKSYYWHDSPNLIYHRIGVVMSVGAVMAFLSLVVKDLPKFMKQMSRNTLWLYVGHLIIIYQFVKPLIGYQTRFNVPITLICIITMFILMYLQTRIILYIQKNNGYIETIKLLIHKKSS